MMTLPKNILHWSTTDVAHWLERNHFQSEVESFRNHQIDGKALLLLHKSDIAELITHVGPRVKFRAKHAQLTWSRNCMENNVYNNNENIAYNNISSRNTNQPNQWDHRYVIENPSSCEPGVRYNRNKNGVLSQPNQQYVATNMVKQYNQPNFPANNSASSLKQHYNVQNDQRSYSMGNYEVHGISRNDRLPRSNNNLEVGYNASPSSLQPISQRTESNLHHMNTVTANVETSSSSVTTETHITEVKKEKDGSPTNFWNDSPLSSQSGYNGVNGTQDGNGEGIGENIKNNDHLPGNDVAKIDAESEGRNSKNVSSGKDDITSNVVLLDSSMKNQRTTYILDENDEERQELDNIQDITGDFHNSSTNMFDEGRQHLGDDSALDDERYEVEDDGSMHYYDSSRLEIDETRHLDEDKTSILIEDERRQGGEFQEMTCGLTEEERCQMEEDENLEIHSNSSGTYEQNKDCRSEQSIDIITENERNLMMNEMNGHTQHDTNDLSMSMVQNENYDSAYYGFENSSQQKLDSKRSIEHVTNRLALRERSKIFRRSEKKWHVSVNETAYQLALKDPMLLQNKRELRMIAEAEVRKTYRFAKGKSRSIAIPENRLMAEERKKQKLTKDKINDMKRQLNSEGEELSRQLRQCHMNITLATQQSDVTRTMQLRERMQRLNEQQAKLHFKMDDLLSKERKLNVIKTNNSNILDVSLHNNYNPNSKPTHQNHIPYGYGHGNFINQSVISVVPQHMKTNTSSPSHQKPVLCNTTDHNNGQYVYRPNKPIHLHEVVDRVVNQGVNVSKTEIVNLPPSADETQSRNEISVSSESSVLPHVKHDTNDTHANENNMGQYSMQGNSMLPMNKNPNQYYIDDNAPPSPASQDNINSIHLTTSQTLTCVN